MPARVAQELDDWRDHLRATGKLATPAIHHQPDLQRGQIDIRVGWHELAERAGAIESLGDLPGLTLGFKTVLLVAERKIQRHANADNRGAGLRGGSVAQFAVDQQRDLGLVMHAAAVHRHPYGRPEIDHAGGRLDEQQRLLRHRVAQLGRVSRVVAPHADHFANGQSGE